MKWVISVFLLVPFIATVLLRIILHKIGMTKRQATTYAIDFTTFVLIFTIPILIQSIWGVSVIFIFIMSLVVIAITLTYFEWRSAKEIKIPVLLKKIWRIYFIILACSYFVVLLVGFIYWMYTYMTR